MFTTLAFAENEALAKFALRLFEDREGNLWAGTHRGLFVLERKGPTVKLKKVEIGLPADGDRQIAAASG